MKETNPMESDITSAGLRGAARLLRAQVNVPAEASHQMLLFGSYRVAADFLDREAGKLEAEMAKASQATDEDAPVKHDKWGN
jgi:hypothetical protein